MAANFRIPERDQLFLIPPSLQEWIPEDDIVHFVIEAAELVPMDDFHISDHGGGKLQYHPHMMLALLLYSYSHGIFSSRNLYLMSWETRIMFSQIMVMLVKSR